VRIASSVDLDEPKLLEKVGRRAGELAERRVDGCRANAHDDVGRASEPIDEWGESGATAPTRTIPSDRRSHVRKRRDRETRPLLRRCDGNDEIAITAPFTFASYALHIFGPPETGASAHLRYRASEASI
jgi:hypothetical protein